MKKIIKPSFWHKYNGKSVIVFDNIFSQKYVEAFGIWMLGLNYQRRPSFDNELSVGIETETYKTLPKLPQIVSKTIENYYSKMSKKRSPQKLSHLYAASVRYGDHTIIHQDIDCANCITFLYYGNIHWDSAWGGETVFFDNDKNAMFAVSPKSGRLVLFNAQLYHRTGIPMKNSSSMRYGLSIFFRCENQIHKSKNSAKPREK